MRDNRIFWSISALFLLIVLLLPRMSTAFTPIKALQVQPPRPNDCTYWVTDNLLAGEHPTDEYEDSRQKLKQYLHRGITYFVDLTGEEDDYYDLLLEEAKDMNLPMPIEYKRCAIPDFGVPTKPQMKEILDTLDEAIDAQHKVYIHCRGGIGRTGTTVGCYLARHGHTGEEALQEVNRLFQFSERSMLSSMSPETTEQVRFVQTWQE